MVRAVTLTLAKWTLDDYHRMVASGVLAERHVELLNGTIVEMPPEGPDHAGSSTSAREYLNELLGKRVLVRDAKPITLPHLGSEPEPDIAVIARRDDFYREQHPYPDEVFLLIEFADSSLQKDLEEKRDLYAAAGIMDYWVVNLRDRNIIVFQRPSASIYQIRQDYCEGHLILTAFPDIEVSVQKLLV